MIRRLFSKSRKRPFPSGPEGSRAYAIGDIHGRLDLLRDLIRRIERDDERRGPARSYLVFLGDLIDRGPDSRGVVECLRSSLPSRFRPIFLKGNHEEFLMNVLAGHPEMVGDWLTYGGYECAESYGVSKGWTLNVTAEEVTERLRAQVPASHRKFLEEMADSFRFGDYLFVHAGIRPGVPLEEQTGKDLRWIRDGFLDDRSNHGVMVVHGHTIVERPEQHGNRIAIDTGAYRSGTLTAIGLEDDERWFIQASEARAAA